MVKTRVKVASWLHFLSADTVSMYCCKTLFFCVGFTKDQLTPVGQWAGSNSWSMSNWCKFANDQLMSVRVWQMDKQTNGLNLTIISLDFYNHWNIVGCCPGWLRLLGQGLVTVATKFKTSVTVACSAGHWSPSRAEILVNGALNWCPASLGSSDCTDQWHPRRSSVGQ